MITVGPVRPGPIRAGADTPRSVPFANTTFAVENEKGTAASFTTDDQGRFRLSLAPGHYTVSPTIGRHQSFDVDVVAGRVTKVEWHCDTGMR